MFCLCNNDVDGYCDGDCLQKLMLCDADETTFGRTTLQSKAALPLTNNSTGHSRKCSSVLEGALDFVRIVELGDAAIVRSSSTEPSDELDCFLSHGQFWRASSFFFAHEIIDHVMMS